MKSWSQGSGRAEGMSWKHHPTSETQTLLCLPKWLHIAVCNSKGQGSTAQEISHILHSEILAKVNSAKFLSIFLPKKLLSSFKQL